MCRVEAHGRQGFDRDMPPVYPFRYRPADVAAGMREEAVFMGFQGRWWRARGHKMHILNDIRSGEPLACPQGVITFCPRACASAALVPPFP